MSQEPNLSPSELLQSLLREQALLVNGEAHQKSIDELSQSIESLEFQIEHLKRMLFGRKSEQLISKDQLKFAFLEDAKKITSASLPEPKITVTYQRRQKVKKLPEYEGRFPEHLPREDAGVIELSPQEKLCPDCGTERVQISEEISERLSYKHHVSYTVKQYRRPVCSCPQCKDNIVQAPAPKTPLPGVQVESSFFAHVTSEKFEYGLPFYRIEDRLLSQGLYITRTTLCEYQNKLGKLLQPLGDELLKVLKESGYVHADETSWQVARVKDGKNKYMSAWAWAFVGANGDVFLKYGTSRNKTSVHEVFGEYEGVVVCDGEDHYDFYKKTSSKIKLARCNAHARRKFEHALTNDEKAAKFGLRIYQTIYRRERYLQERGNKLKPDDIVRLRRRTKWLLERLLKFCQGYSCVPKSPIGKACNYFRKYYRHLEHFCSDGALPIDNNPVERLIRIFVIGRKAWIFSSSEEGAKSAAILYSLVLTCKQNSIPVVEYLTDVIERIGVKGETDYREMLPRAWHSARLATLQPAATSPAAS